MGAIKSGAKWGLRAITFKVVAPALALLVPLGVVLFFGLFLAVTGGAIGAGGKAQEEQDAQVQNVSQQCQVKADGDGDKGGTINVPAEYKEDVKKAAEVSGLPEQIVAAQIQQESQWNPNAGSPVGAQGIAQFMPDTWSKYGGGKDVHDPHAAFEGYGKYMKALGDEVSNVAGGDANKKVQLTLAAYNAGPGAVQSAHGVPPYPETKDYVEKITGGGQVKFSQDCKAPTGGKAWDGDLGKGEWTVPLPASQVTSGYGPRNVPGLPAWAQQHVGVDFVDDDGHGKIVSPSDLKITGIFKTDGCLLGTMTAEPKFRMAFCHMDSFDVQPGATVKRGDVLGQEGNHAESVGGGVINHLHFEIHKPGADYTDSSFNPYDGSAIDPEPILKEKGAWAPKGG